MDPNTFPTKGNLILAKNSLALSLQGFDLMDKKRNILIREMMNLIDEAKGIQSQIDVTFREAYAALQRANMEIGINTVQLDGAGFEAYVAQGDKVKCGDKLILADLKLINEKGLNPQTMMILPEGGELKAEVYPLAGADAGTMAMAVRR